MISLWVFTILIKTRKELILTCIYIKFLVIINKIAILPITIVPIKVGIVTMMGTTIILFINSPPASFVPTFRIENISCANVVANILIAITYGTKK